MTQLQPPACLCTLSLSVWVFPAVFFFFGSRPSDTTTTTATTDSVCYCFSFYYLSISHPVLLHLLLLLSESKQQSTLHDVIGCPARGTPYLCSPFPLPRFCWLWLPLQVPRDSSLSANYPNRASISASRANLICQVIYGVRLPVIHMYK